MRAFLRECRSSAEVDIIGADSLPMRGQYDTVVIPDYHVLAMHTAGDLGIANHPRVIAHFDGVIAGRNDHAREHFHDIELVATSSEHDAMMLRMIFPCPVIAVGRGNNVEEIEIGPNPWECEYGGILYVGRLWTRAVSAIRRIAEAFPDVAIGVAGIRTLDLMRDSSSRHERSWFRSAEWLGLFPQKNIWTLGMDRAEMIGDQKWFGPIPFGSWWSWAAHAGCCLHLTPGDSPSGHLFAKPVAYWERARLWRSRMDARTPNMPIRGMRSSSTRGMIQSLLCTQC